MAITIHQVMQILENGEHCLRVPCITTHTQSWLGSGAQPHMRNSAIKKLNTENFGNYSHLLMHGFILVIYRRKEPCYSKIILGIWEKCTHCVKLCQDVYLMSCANCTQTRPEEIDLLGFFYVVGSFYKKTNQKKKPSRNNNQFHCV